MPTLYKLITAILGVTGCISLLITGELNPVMTISGIAILPGYYRFMMGMQPASKWLIGTFSGLTLAVFAFDAMFVTGEVFLAVAHLTVTFQAIKSFDLKEPWDHLQVYFMALLQLIIASELTSSLIFGIEFIIFLVLFVAAMVLSHFLKENVSARFQIRNTVISISVITLFITIVIFAVLPRTSQKILGKSHARGIKTAGFSEKVDFGAFGEVKLDPTVVMRVEMKFDKGFPYYWRGMTLDYFDGFSWRNTLIDRYKIEKEQDEFIFRPYDREKAIEQRIYLEPLDSDVLFGIERVSGVKVNANVLMTDNAEGIFMPAKLSRRIDYTVYSIDSIYPGKMDKRYLQMPEGFERVKKLALNLTANITDNAQKASIIEQYLRNNYEYSLQTQPPQSGMSPVEHFLFNTKKGYCEYYASVMVLMLRSLGIQSRVVTGFYGGERNDYGGYIIVRQSDAHSWVEAMIDGFWKRFDPTPAVSLEKRSVIALYLDSLKLKWFRYVIGYSSDDQKAFVRMLYLPFERMPARLDFSLKDLRYYMTSLFLITAIVVMLYIIVRRIRYRRYSFVTKQYLKLRKMLLKKGLKIQTTTTSGELIRIASGIVSTNDLREFISLYEKYRFGKKEMDSDTKKRYRELLKRCRV